MPGQPNQPLLNFDVTNLTVVDSGQTPNLVIGRTEAFSVTVDFKFGGLLASWLMGLGVNCAVRVKYESLGEGPEGTWGPATVITVAGQPAYTGTINVPANHFAAGEEGAYKLVGTVTVPGSPIAGYFEGPILQII